MKITALSLLSLGCAAAASREGEAAMDRLMSVKLEQREKFRAQGLFNANQYPDMGSQKCVNGKAGEYSCENVDLLAFLSHQAMGSTTREGNDIWGMIPN